MKFISVRLLRLASVASLAFLAAVNGRSQTVVGVDAFGSLFSLNLSAPTAASTIGNLGFVPEGIDFRPGTSTLFAIDVGATTTRLYTVDVATGAAMGIGVGFATAGTVGALSYDLSTASSFGFDFNPTTLQADGSIRIRLTGNNGTNLRLNSDTGGIAAVDGLLTGSIGAVAYTNSAVATMGGITALFDIDYMSNSLFFQNPPNAGTLNSVGALGFDVGPNIGFDILTRGGDNFGYLVDTIGSNAANLYSVNLSTGAATALGTANRSFTGGFAVVPVPEPSTYGLAAAGVLVAVTLLRRRSKTTAK
ncbi:MAG: DUF4394 domain-containing protein [Opitutaceae bacterium]